MCKAQIFQKNGDFLVNNLPHNHDDNAQSTYLEKKSWELVENYIQNSSEKVKSGKITSREIFDAVKATYGDFCLTYDKHGRTIRNKVNKVRHGQYHVRKINQRQKANRNVASPAKICLNALGKKLLKIDRKYKHLLQFPEEEVEREPNLDDVDDKSTCKICFLEEATIRFSPCGHIICESCHHKIRELERKKLRNIYISERTIEARIKIKCHKCRSPVKGTQVIFY